MSASGLSTRRRPTRSFTASPAKHSWYDNANAYRLRYKPEDDSEPQAAQGLSAEAGQPKNPIAEKYQGGAFCGDEYDAKSERA
jgi:uronate dehydrogenase